MENQEIEKRRHSAAHLMARAISNVFENVQVDIGPATDDGFYYDFDSDVSFTPDMLAKLESEMKKIVKENLLITRSECK